MWSYYWMAIWSLLYILCNFEWYEYIKMCFYLGFLEIILQGIFLWRYICNSTSLCNNCLKSKIQWFNVFKFSWYIRVIATYSSSSTSLPTARSCPNLRLCQQMCRFILSMPFSMLILPGIIAAYSLNKEAHLKAASCIAYAVYSHKWWLELLMTQYKMMHLICAKDLLLQDKVFYSWSCWVWKVS